MRAHYFPSSATTQTMPFNSYTFQSIRLRRKIPQAGKCHRRIFHEASLDWKTIAGAYSKGLNFAFATSKTNKLTNQVIPAINHEINVSTVDRLHIDSRTCCTNRSCLNWRLLSFHWVQSICCWRVLLVFASRKHRLPYGSNNARSKVTKIETLLNHWNLHDRQHYSWAKPRHWTRAQLREIVANCFTIPLSILRPRLMAIDTGANWF